MGCTCDYDPDGVGPDVFESKMVRARRRHQCCECDEPIEIGELHRVDSGLWDGYWSRHRMCAPCARISRDLCPCHQYGQLRVDIREIHGFDYLTGEEI